MAKKVYDIFHPNSRVEVSPKNPPSRERRTTIFFFSLLVSALLLLGYNSLIQVKIKIHPKTELVTYSGTVNLRTDRFQSDSEAIAGKLFSLTLSDSKSFSSTGREREEVMAEGVLRVYNEGPNNPQTLVTNTRFVSADGRLFRSTEAIQIPSKGHTDVVVRASEPGEGYDIEKKTSFSLPGLQGSDLYLKIYAENPGPITGGFIGDLSVITAKDIENAKELMKETLLERAKSTLKEENPEYIFDEIEIKIVSELVEPGEGERFESFNYSMEAEFEVVTFKKSDIENYFEELLLSELDDDEELWKESIVSSYNLIRGDVTLLEFNLSGLSYPSVPEELIKEELAKKRVETAIKMLNDYDFESVELEARPSWLKKMPRGEKIKVDVEVRG